MASGLLLASLAVVLADAWLSRSILNYLDAYHNNVSNVILFARLLDVFSRRHRQTARMRKGKVARNRIGGEPWLTNRKAICRQSRRIRFASWSWRHPPGVLPSLTGG